MTSGNTKKSLDILEGLLQLARQSGADAADAIHVESTDISASQRMGKPEGIERSESSAIGLRAFVGERHAIASSTDTSQTALAELAQRAVDMAKAAPPDALVTLAPVARRNITSPALDLLDDKEPEVSWLMEQCRTAEETARNTQGITNSEGADASYSRHTVSLAIQSPDAPLFAQQYHSSYFSLSVSVLAGEGTGMERDYDFTSARHRSDLASATSIGAEAAKGALKRLNPRKVKSCQVPVLFDPRVSRSILQILAGAISGSSVARGSSFLKDALNTDIFTKDITITDDPHRIRGLGSKPFDAEGVANHKRNFIENGTLTSWILDMRSANKLGLQTTGHATRGIGSPPSPSATNLYMQAGSQTPAQLMSDIKSGFYITETFGMGVNIVTGDYSQGAAGFWIENGQLAYPVSEVTIAGHLRDMFSRLTAANDLEFRYATNAPTLRVDGMTVAGT